MYACFFAGNVYNIFTMRMHADIFFLKKVTIVDGVEIDLVEKVNIRHGPLLSIRSLACAVADLAEQYYYFFNKSDSIRNFLLSLDLECENTDKSSDKFRKDEWNNKILNEVTTLSRVHLITPMFPFVDANRIISDLTLLVKLRDRLALYVRNYLDCDIDGATEDFTRTLSCIAQALDRIKNDKD